MNTSKNNKRNEVAAMTAILNRASSLKIIPNNDRISLYMDLEGARIDIYALMDTDDNTFCHDVIGIYNNFNRVTKKVENCFVPRVGFLKN